MKDYEKSDQPTNERKQKLFEFIIDQNAKKKKKPKVKFKNMKNGYKSASPNLYFLTQQIWNSSVKLLQKFLNTPKSSLKFLQTSFTDWHLPKDHSLSFRSSCWLCSPWWSWYHLCAWGLCSNCSLCLEPSFLINHMVKSITFSSLCLKGDTCSTYCLNCSEASHIFLSLVFV